MNLKSAVADVIRWEKEMESNPCPGGGELSRVMRIMEKLGKKDHKGVWNILRNGTEDEFSALCNSLPEFGVEFDEDDACKEILRIAKKRRTKTAIETVRFTFPVRFEQFWNETEPAAETAVQSRTFDQVM